MVTLNETGSYDTTDNYPDVPGEWQNEPLDHTSDYDPDMPDYAGEPIFETENDLYEWRLRELRRILGREDHDS
jgi:hypothetical protein